MQKFKFVLTLSSLLLSFLTLAAINKTPIMVAKTAPQFEIRLQSNPTTGYSWFLTSYDNSLIIPIKHKFQPPQKMMPGAPGHEVWTFKVKADAFIVPTITEIHLTYARPWSLKGSQPQIFKVVIHN